MWPLVDSRRKAALHALLLPSAALLLGYLYPTPVCFPVLKAPHFFSVFVAVCSALSFSHSLPS